MGGKGKGKKKNGKAKRNGNNNSSLWVGKHKVLVKTRGRGFGSMYFVVDLQMDIIEMENPYKLWSDGYLGSAVVFREEEDSIAVYEFGGCMEDDFNFTDPEPAKDDYIIHSFSGTSKSILNLKTNPPIWSKWEDCRAKTTKYWSFPYSVTLGNKIFAFGGIGQVGQVYHDTTTAKDKKKAKWKDMTTPFLTTPGLLDYRSGEVISRCPIVSPPIMSDPKNNRLILYFETECCLYAYYPDNEKERQWECLERDMKTLPGMTAQLVDDVIYFFGSPYTIHAYDIYQRKWLKVSWRRKKLEDCDMFFSELATLMHLGDGMMCLAISYPPRPIGSLQFLRFRVRRVADEDVQLTVVSYHNFNTHPGRAWAYTPF